MPLMFTGLIQAVGRIKHVEPADTGARLIVDADGWDHRPAPGDSIAVSGCCLTHAPGNDASELAFDVVHETLRKTKLGSLGVGDRVNLEPCLRPTDRIGGHFVLGHVDTPGKVVAIETDGGEHNLTIEVPADFVVYLPPTGSIAVDGVALTLAHVDPAAYRFTVALIPTTLEATTLGDLTPGDTVNLEADILVKSLLHARNCGFEG